MSLLKALPALREMERAAANPPAWPCPAGVDVFTCVAVGAAPAMLSVLGCFREGDAELFADLMYAIHNHCIDSEQYDMLERLQRAAHLMEAEGDE